MVFRILAKKWFVLKTLGQANKHIDLRERLIRNLREDLSALKRARTDLRKKSTKSVKVFITKG